MTSTHPSPEHHDHTALTAMERLNPKSAADVAQDKAIEEFLQGKSDGTKPVKEHRHK